MCLDLPQDAADSLDPWMNFWDNNHTAHSGHPPECAQVGPCWVHGSSHRWKGKRQLLLHPPVGSQLCCCKLRANLLKILGQGLFKSIPEFVIRTKART